MQITVESIIQPSALTLSPQTSLAKAVTKMSEARASCVLVVEDQQLVGIFTERDVVRLISSKTPLAMLTLAELMTRNVITLKSSEVIDIFSVSRMFNQHKIRHVPVLDDNNQVIGVATPESVRNHLKPEYLLRYIRVAEVMEKKIIHGLPDESIFSLTQKMARHRVSCVVINEDKSLVPIGIVTERDTVRFHSMGLDFDKVSAQAVMSKPLSTVHSQDSLWSVHQKMQDLKVRRLVATESNGKLAGIITQTQLLKLLDPSEMYHVMQQMQELIDHQTNELLQLNQDLQAANTKLMELATIDELTQLANRRHFNEYLDQEWQYLKYHAKPLSLIMCDVDHFKSFNDTYGHFAGDQCLKQIAQALQEGIRISTDLVARYGGEEFAIILPNTDAAGAEIVIKKIHVRLQELRIPHAGSMTAEFVTISMGAVTVIPDSDSSTDTLLQIADQLLYQSKQQGRNTYRLEVVGSAATAT